MSSILRRAVTIGLLALLWLVPSLVQAHGFRPAVLALTEEAPGVYRVQWTAPVDTSGVDAPVEPVFPDPCRRTQARLDCTPGDLRGAIVFEGLERHRARVVVVVRRLDGSVHESIVTSDQPRLQLSESVGESASTWLRLGLEHIVIGLDHVAFVLGLLLLVGTASLRRLVLTITTFTLAHSLTLLLASGGWLQVSAAPVEATIAASVLLVAREATHRRATATRRWPWAVAAVFGLVHGLGFAGAFASVGAGQTWSGWSLVWFNLGVELGQLAIVVIAVVAAKAARPRLDRLRLPACYALGGLAAWWFLERLLVVLTVRS